MSTLVADSKSSGLNGLSVRALLARAWALNWPLTLVVVTHVLLTGAALIGLLVDSRIVTGAPVWLKPMKFAISISVYSITFIWLLSFVKSRPRAARAAANATAIGFVIEIVIIAGQAWRGTSSHFNLTTPLDSWLFRIMGAFIVVVWLGGLALVIILRKENVQPAAFALSLRLGLAISLAGAAVGFVMVVPTGRQIGDYRATGKQPPAMGAHAVGVPDGGQGLPVVGWSTEGGDLRASHFVGLHALQVLPLFGWFVSRRRSRLNGRVQSRLVWVAGEHILAFSYSCCGRHSGVSL